MPLFAAKRPDGMDGRIRLLKKGSEKRTRLPYFPYALFISSGPYSKAYLDQNNQLNPVDTDLL